MVKPTIAFRRSLQRLRLSAENSLRLPQPIITDAAPAPASPPMTSIDASIASDDSRFKLQKESSCGSNDSSVEAKHLAKRLRTSRKWNMFCRLHSRSNTKTDSKEVQATVIAVEKKRVAFYAMVDCGLRRCEADKHLRGLAGASSVGRGAPHHDNPA